MKRTTTICPRCGYKMTISHVMGRMGAKGGAAATGEKKTRSAEHYRRAGLASAEARRKAKEAKEGKEEKQ